MKKTLDDYLQALPPDRRQKVEKRAAELIAEEMTLQDLRKAVKESQKSLAAKLHIRQGAVSKIEHRTDMYVSTLRGYVQAMGGTLDIVASFPNRNPVKISLFEALAEDAK